MLGQEWTEAEREQAEALARQGKTYREIGVELGRTRKSVQVMLSRRRDGQMVRRKVVPWTIEQVALVDKLHSEGKKPREIAKAVGRHLTHVYSKIQYLEKAYTGKPKPSLQIPPDTEREWRERRAAEYRDLTAALCGDPLPGYSALERRA